MSGENEDFDIAQSMAAELTDSVGVPDAVDDGEALPGRMADAVDEYDTAMAEKDLRVSNDVEDTEAAEQERESQRGKRSVPLAALQEERAKRQELQAQLAAHQQQLAQYQQQQMQLQQYQQQLQQQAEADAVPDFDSDPRAYIEHRERQFQQALGNLQNQQAQQQAVADFQREAEVIKPLVTQAENAFRAEHSDYDQAFDFVRQHAEQNMRAQHPGASEADMQMLRTATLVQFAKQCQANGINPAEHIYGRAQELGFTPGRRVPASQSQGYMVSAPKQANTSLSNLGGAPRAPDEKGRLTAAAVNDMSDADFDDLFERMGRASHVGLKF